MTTADLPEPLQSPLTAPEKLSEKEPAALPRFPGRQDPHDEGSTAASPQWSDDEALLPRLRSEDSVVSKGRPRPLRRSASFTDGMMPPRITSTSFAKSQHQRGFGSGPALILGSSVSHPPPPSLIDEAQRATASAPHSATTTPQPVAADAIAAPSCPLPTPPVPAVIDADVQMQLRHSRTHKFLTALASSGGIVPFLRKVQDVDNPGATSYSASLLMDPQHDHGGDHEELLAASLRNHSPTKISATEPLAPPPQPPPPQPPKLAWEDATWAELAAMATSASCRNFFKSREADEMASSSSSSRRSGEDDSSSSSSCSSNDSALSDTSPKTVSGVGSDDLRQCADGRPKAPKVIVSLVKPGRRLPMQLVDGRGCTVAWTTLIVDVDPEQHAAHNQLHDAAAADDDEDIRKLVERSQWLHYTSWMRAFRSPALLRDMVLRKSGAVKEMAYRSVVEKMRKLTPVELDPYFLDDPSIKGELRLKRINLPSYCSSVIVYTEHGDVRNELDQRFFHRHPDCERRGIRLTTIRRIKCLLLAASLDHGSPLDVSTVVHAVCYFERLVVSGFVDSANRRIVASVCLLLATKFYESGIVKRSEMQRKMRYVVARMEDAFGVDARMILAWELKVYVALEFNLVLPKKTGLAYLVALLALRRLSPADFFGQHESGSDSDASNNGSSSTTSDD